MSDYNCLHEVPRNASPEDIRRAHRQLQLGWHPDKNPASKAKAQARFKNISEAYEVLSGESRNRHYDQHGRGGQDTGRHADFARSRGASAYNSGTPSPYRENPSELYREFFGSSDAFQDLYRGMRDGQCGPTVLTGGFPAYQQNSGSTVRTHFFIDLDDLMLAPQLSESGVCGSSAGFVAAPTQQIGSLPYIKPKRTETCTPIRDGLKAVLYFENSHLISDNGEHAMQKMTTEAPPGPSTKGPRSTDRTRKRPITPHGRSSAVVRQRGQARQRHVSLKKTPERPPKATPPN
ncbi:hypothetical protein HPB50_013492 [Hyalomma asiaticum]|uniref:Uncharacterized protein n=1 Tax=Hyalomma asiaticum TaxID=266040 RepID=A0ACB7SBA8_HYAAI|nr:hypothetical protein HPB50_013492 [Hyalomma asiaticum]